MRMEEATVLFCIRTVERRLKLRAERHLNLPRAANGLIDVAQPEGAIVKAAGLVRSAAAGWQRCRPLRRKPVEKLILGNGVDEPFACLAFREPHS